MKFIRATCPGCGATLELADHLQSATCPNCGSKVLIEWETKQNPAANLGLAKRFIQSGNYKEADVQLTRVLEMNPDNREAWFWKGVAQYTLKQEPLAGELIQKSGYGRREIIQQLTNLMGGSQLREVGFQARLYAPRRAGGRNWVFPTVDYSLCLLFAESTLKAQKDKLSRQDLLVWLEVILFLISIDYENFDYRNFPPTLFEIATMVLNELGADQPNDGVKGTINDWRGRWEVREKPSYWRQWIQNRKAFRK